MPLCRRIRPGGRMELRWIRPLVPAPRAPAGRTIAGYWAGSLVAAVWQSRRVFAVSNTRVPLCVIALAAAACAGCTCAQPPPSTPIVDGNVDDSCCPPAVAVRPASCAKVKRQCTAPRDAQICYPVSGSTKVAFTEAGLHAFTTIFERASAQGFENAMVRALNSTRICPACKSSAGDVPEPKPGADEVKK